MRGLTNSRSGGGSNLNLLDNWDFTNPVNQRGKSTYADEGYTIDRWRKIGGTVSINNNRLNLSGAHSSTSYIVDIRQLLDSDTISAIAGKTVTLSVDCAVNSISGEFYISLANDTKKEYPAPVFTSGFSRKIISYTQRIPSNWESTDSVRFTIGTNGTKVNADIYAAKLELGEVSTLKNDALGMSYDKELYKCQKYLQIIRNESNNEYVTIFDSVPWQVTRDFIAYRLIRPMRKTPVLTYVNIRAQTANGYFYPINIYIEQDDTIISEDVPLVKLRIESADNTNYPLPNEAYLMNIGAKGYIMFSADL